MNDAQANSLAASLTLLNTLVAAAMRVSERIQSGRLLDRNEVLAERDRAKSALDAAIESAERTDRQG